MDDLDPRIDALYAEPPALFTKARDALVRQMSAEGDRAAAASLRRLRRPSALAAELNRLVREDGARVEALLEAQDGLAAAQRRMLGGSGGAEDLRAAEQAESTAVGAFPGGPPLHAALRFAARSPALREELRRGVLSRDPVPGDDGEGPFAFGPAPAPAPPPPPDELAAARAKRAARATGRPAGAPGDDAGKAAATDAKEREERDAERARRLRLVTDELDAARAAERAAAAGRDAAAPRAERAEAGRTSVVAELERLRHELSEAERRLAGAERERAEADAALAEAQAAADAARTAREEAERAAREALEEASREGSD